VCVGERESVCVCVCERKRERVCVWMCLLDLGCDVSVCTVDRVLGC